MSGFDYHQRRKLPVNTRDVFGKLRPPWDGETEGEEFYELMTRSDRAATVFAPGPEPLLRHWRRWKRRWWPQLSKKERRAAAQSMHQLGFLRHELEIEEEL